MFYKSLCPLVLFLLVVIVPTPVLSSDTVVGLSESQSFIDLGLKALIFSDGQVYAYRKTIRKPEALPRFYMFELDQHQLSILVEIFQERNFKRLPQNIREADTLDGNGKWLFYAESDDDHHVLTYAVRNEDVEAIYYAFDKTISPNLISEYKVEARIFCSRLKRRISRMNRASKARKATTLWLDYAARRRPHCGVDFKKSVENFGILGDGAAVYREYRILKNQ